MKLACRGRVAGERDSVRRAWGRGTGDSAPRAPFAERLCLLLTVPFISESLIVSDSQSKYKVLFSSFQPAVQTPFPSGREAPSWLLTDLPRPWTTFLHTPGIRLHFPCFPKQAALLKAWREEAKQGREARSLPSHFRDFGK